MVTLISNQQLNYNRDAVVVKAHNSSKLIFSDAFAPEKNELKRLGPQAKVVVMQQVEKVGQAEFLEFLADHQLSNQEVDEDLLLLWQNLKLYQSKLQKKLNAYTNHEAETALTNNPDAITCPLQDNVHQKQTEFMAKLQAAIEPMLYDANLDVEKICHLVGMSKTNLFTKLKALTGQSITLYIRKLRLAKSRELLANADMTVAEVAYNVGFNDPKYFTRVFTEEYGESPKEVKSKR